MFGCSHFTRLCVYASNPSLLLCPREAHACVTCTRICMLVPNTKYALKDTSARDEGSLGHGREEWDEEKDLACIRTTPFSTVASSLSPCFFLCFALFLHTFFLMRPRLLFPLQPQIGLQREDCFCAQPGWSVCTRQEKHVSRQAPSQAHTFAHSGTRVAIYFMYRVLLGPN